jgi:hypothetical protein
MNLLLFTLALAGEAEKVTRLIESGKLDKAVEFCKEQPPGTIEADADLTVACAEAEVRTAEMSDSDLIFFAALAARWKGTPAGTRAGERVLSARADENWNNLKKLKELVAQYSDCPSVPEVKKRIYELAFAEAEKKNTVEVWRAFGEDYPSAPQAEEAAKREEARAWEVALTARTSQAMLDFSDSYGSSVHAGEAKKRAQDLAFAEAERSENPVKAWADLLDQWPEHPRKTEAQNHLEDATLAALIASNPAGAVAWVEARAGSVRSAEFLKLLAAGLVQLEVEGAGTDKLALNPDSTPTLGALITKITIQASSIVPPPTLQLETIDGWKDAGNVLEPLLQGRGFVLNPLLSMSAGSSGKTTLNLPYGLCSPEAGTRFALQTRIARQEVRWQFTVDALCAVAPPPTLNTALVWKDSPSNCQPAAFRRADELYRNCGSGEYVVPLNGAPPYFRTELRAAGIPLSSTPTLPLSLVALPPRSDKPAPGPPASFQAKLPITPYDPSSNLQCPAAPALTTAVAYRHGTLHPRYQEAVDLIASSISGPVGNPLASVLADLDGDGTEELVLHYPNDRFAGYIIVVKFVGSELWLYPRYGMRPIADVGMPTIFKQGSHFYVRIGGTESGDARYCGYTLLRWAETGPELGV